MRNNVESKKTPEELRRDLEVYDPQPNIKALRGEDPVVNNMLKSYREFEKQQEKKNGTSK